MNVEVLAPIGSYEIALQVLESNCDAVYLGGIDFNMRMHSKLLNLTNEEIEQTVILAHELNKKVYVTVNVWFDDDETKMLSDYLVFLNKVGVDAIIVQDLGIISLVKKLDLSLEIHTSVMMNVHNKDEAIALENDFGITRFVLSREMPLAQVKEVSDAINAEIEYFVSGDMCSVNGGICYASSIMFNKSANKGQCFKMCRWNYDLKYKGNKYKPSYYLAAKDMDMLGHIDKLIEAGVNSLKIEGRRKKVEDTLDLINKYGEAVKKYNEGNYNSSEFENVMDHMYPRSTSTAFALGNPGLDYINSKNEGNPEVVRIFSKKGKELPMSKRKLDNASKFLNDGSGETQISVKVDNVKDAQIALKANVTNLYLSIESFSQLMSIEEMQKIIDQKNTTKIYLSMPIMQSPASLLIEEEYMSMLQGIDGVEVSDYGQIQKYKANYDIKTSFTFNVMNKEAATLLHNAGASSIMPSIEATPKQLTALKSLEEVSVDILTFGRLTTMYSDLNFYDNIDEGMIVSKEDNKNVSNDILVLQNGTGMENPVRLDNYDKSHIQTEAILNYIPLFDKIKGNNLVIDARCISTLEYELALKTLKALSFDNEIKNETTEESSNKYFLGALNHTVKGAKYVIVK